MLALIYINPNDAEPEAAFGPFASQADADDWFDTHREDSPCPPDWARWIALTNVEVEAS